MKEISFGGYEITARQIPHNGMYELSTIVESMGGEYRERMLADTLDDETLEKFVKQIEHNK